MPLPKLSDAGKELRAARLGKTSCACGCGVTFPPYDSRGRRVRFVVGHHHALRRPHGNSRHYVTVVCPECGLKRPAITHPERKYLICQECWSTFWPDGRLAELPPPASFTLPGNTQERVKSRAARPFRGSKWKDYDEEDDGGETTS